MIPKRLNKTHLIWLIPVIFGLLMSLAFQPACLWFLAFPALGLFFFFRELSTWKRFFFGWLSGFFVQVFGFYWIFLTIRDFGGLSIWISALGAFLFWAFQGLDFAIWFALSPLLFSGEKNRFAWMGDAGFLFILQSFLFPYVFPWVISACLSSSPARFSAHIWSAYGMTFWLVFSSLALGMLVKTLVQNKLTWSTMLASLIPLFCGLACLFSGVLFYPKMESSQTLRVGVIQPNIIPWAKRDRHSFKEVFDAHVKPTTEMGMRGVDLVVWPETAISIHLKNYPDYIKYFSELADSIHAGLILGCLGQNENGYTNEVWLFAPGEKPQVYQKEKLVMFSEALPWVFSWAGYFVEGMGQFGVGLNNHPFTFRGIQIEPLVCFEAMLPHHVEKMRAQLLVNLTNDAWFGKTKASALHLQHVQMRTLEQSAPLVRSANSGISCWVSSDGRVQQPTGVYQPEFPVFEVPIPDKTQTPFWNWAEKGVILATILLFFSFRKQSQKK